MRFDIKSILLLCGIGLLPGVARPATPTVTIAPAPAVIAFGQSLQFKASVTGLASSAVRWAVSPVSGAGAISATGIYKAPAAGSASSIKVGITAVGSDGTTQGSATLTVEPAGPAIESVTPNPIAPGRYFIVVHGSGFEPGAVVSNAGAALNTTYVSSTQLKANGEQVNLTPASFQVQNPGTAAGPAKVVPFKTQGAAPKISPQGVYIHVGVAQDFSAPGATVWSSSGGYMSQTGVLAAFSKMPAAKTVTITATGPGGSSKATAILVDGAVQEIAPRSATVVVGQQQQFVSSGAETWSATYGTISSSGLYTAPKVWPASGVDHIFVNGTHGSANETLTISAPTPQITAVSNSGKLPLGPYSITITGTDFSPGSSVLINGAVQPSTYAGGVIRAAGFFAHPGAATLTVVNQGVASLPFRIQTGVANPLVSPAAARRFLEQGAFGPTPSDAENLQTAGYSAWLNAQFAMPQLSTYKHVSPAATAGMPEQFETNAVEQPDQLRQRVAFALSQIFVTSLKELQINRDMITYQDMLLADAFTNYRQIMEDVTLSAAMGRYLNFANNAKAGTTTGSVANENYAREMMQLFTLGTSLLNADGSLQLDDTGSPIPAYSQFTVTEFSRVYTGWTFAPPPGQPLKWNTYPGGYGSLVVFAEQHDTGSKQLLNGFISPANLSAKADLDKALDNVFTHPNVGPFVSKQLIQHLVKSNPSPAYVARVAAIFNNNGSGVRGDMKAVMTAILLDPEARANDEGGNDLASDGHLQEPALFIAGMIRAFGGQMNDQNRYRTALTSMSQNLFSPDNVFNYYAPTYAVPETPIMGGEFQIQSPNNAVVRADLVADLFAQTTKAVQSNGTGTVVDLSPYLYLAADPAQLADALDLTLTHGVMPAAMKEELVSAITGETGGNLRRVEKGVFLVLTSSYYNVWH